MGRKYMNRVETSELRPSDPLDNLAIFGGKPLFDRKLHVGRPNIGDRDRLISFIDEILDRGWLTNEGPLSREFERRIESLLGVKHCLAICNGTVAMELAIRALGLTGEVILPSFTFIATAHALQWQEITPVFCDIDPQTHNIDPAEIEKLITPRTSGIIGVHVWGRPCDVDAIEAIGAEHGLKVLFDAAPAFGCSYKGRKIGNFGNAEILSFHATKFVNSFEGGAVTTNNDELAAKIRLMRNFGFEGLDNVIYIGTNGKINEACAAMGLTSLEDMNEFIDTNRRNYEAYCHGLAGLPGISVIQYDSHESYNYQYVPIEVHTSTMRITRDDLVKILMAENVRARRYFYPGCHRMEPYRSYYPNSGLWLPHTEACADRILVLPTGTNISVEDVTKICEIIRMVVNNGRDIAKRLSSIRDKTILEWDAAAGVL